MNPIMIQTSNIFLDTTQKVFQCWWMMWMNLFSPPSFVPKMREEQQKTLVVIMPVFLNFNRY